MKNLTKKQRSCPERKKNIFCLHHLFLLMLDNLTSHLFTAKGHNNIYIYMVSSQMGQSHDGVCYQILITTGGCLIITLCLSDICLCLGLTSAQVLLTLTQRDGCHQFSRQQSELPCRSCAGTRTRR